MSDAREPRTNRARSPAPSLRTAAGYTLAGLLLAALVTVLGAPLWAGGVLVLGAGLVGWGVYRREAWPVWSGLVGLAGGSLGVTFPAPIGSDVLVFLLVGGALIALVATALGETGDHALVHPKPATRTHQARGTGLVLLWLILTAAPLAFAATRLALASEIGTTLAVLLVAGVTVLVFGLPLATLRDDRRTVDADELRDRGVRFIVHGVRERDDAER